MKKLRSEADVCLTSPDDAPSAGAGDPDAQAPAPAFAPYTGSLNICGKIGAALAGRAGAVVAGTRQHGAAWGGGGRSILRNRAASYERACDFS